MVTPSPRPRAGWALVVEVLAELGAAWDGEGTPPGDPHSLVWPETAAQPSTPPSAAEPHPEPETAM